MRLLAFLTPTVTASDLADPVKNPDVRPARWWEEAGLWSAVLVLLEHAQETLAGWVDAPWWVPIALFSLPLLVRWIRERMAQRPTLFKAVK